jgi:short-subunit dehydrogenase
MIATPMNDSPSRRTALVTGASAGIGRAFADVFAARGWDLIVTARRRERLDALAQDLTARHGSRVHVVPLDLGETDAGKVLEDEVRCAGLKVDALVNNAGFGVRGTYRRSTWEAQHRCLHVLTTVVAELTHRFLPAMIERGYGRIINVASVAGLVPGAASGFTLYGASKAFVIRFSESLAVETRRHGIHVTAVCPGYTRTEFHEASGVRDEAAKIARFMWMDADTVARQGYDASMAGDVVYVNGALYRAIVLCTRLLPQRLVMAVALRRGLRLRASSEGASR